MPPETKSPRDPQFLVNKLTVVDARHLLKYEGGELTAAGLAVQLASVAVVAALTARAISVGDATVWHLALPMFAQYLALLAALPVVQVIVRHPDLQKETLSSLRVVIGLAIALAVAVAVRSRQLHTTWQDQLSADATIAWRWIADAQMQWPILLAVVGILLAVPGRVRSLFELGPPFMGVSLGCAARAAVMMLGFFLIPLAVESPAHAAWLLWLLILASELLAWGMFWDIQTRLKKLDSQEPVAVEPKKMK